MTFVFRQGTASAVPQSTNAQPALAAEGLSVLLLHALAVFAPVLVAVASEAGPFSLPRAVDGPFSSPL